MVVLLTPLAKNRVHMTSRLDEEQNTDRLCVNKDHGTPNPEANRTPSDCLTPLTRDTHLGISLS